MYLKERHFFAPNVLHGCDPGIAKRLASTASSGSSSGSIRTARSIKSRLRGKLLRRPQGGEGGQGGQGSEAILLARRSGQTLEPGHVQGDHCGGCPSRSSPALAAGDGLPVRPGADQGAVRAQHRPEKELHGSIDRFLTPSLRKSRICPRARCGAVPGVRQGGGVGGNLQDDPSKQEGQGYCASHLEKDASSRRNWTPKRPTIRSCSTPRATATPSCGRWPSGTGARSTASWPPMRPLPSTSKDRRINKRGTVPISLASPRKSGQSP